MNNERIQEIKRRHVEEQAELDARVGTYVRQEHQDRAYLLSEVERLQEDNKVMKPVLEWYENRDNYIPTIEKPTGTLFSEVEQDCGERARTAISHLKG